MTRPSTFRSIKLNYVSSAALTIGVWESPRETVHSGEAVLGFLARLGLWLRLIFGRGAPACKTIDLPEEDLAVNRAKRRAFVHRAKRRSSARKVPAHDLEMLMRFVPGARRGLTLNQYRERLTRISVLGRTQIYIRALSCCVCCLRQFMAHLDVPTRIALQCGALCAAPLWPD